LIVVRGWENEWRSPPLTVSVEVIAVTVFLEGCPISIIQPSSRIVWLYLLDAERICHIARLDLVRYPPELNSFLAPPLLSFTAL
jgi:hypothetical protein